MVRMCFSILHNKNKIINKKKLSIWEKQAQRLMKIGTKNEKKNKKKKKQIGIDLVRVFFFFFTESYNYDSEIIGSKNSLDPNLMESSEFLH